MASDIILWLEDLDLGKVIQGFGDARARGTVDNRPLRLAGKTYEHGIGTHARSEMKIDLKKAATRFEAIAGVDDEVEGRGSVVFEVWVDGSRVAHSNVIYGEDPPVSFSVDLAGAGELVLVVKDAGDGNGSDHADWADAKLVLDPSAKDHPETLPANPLLPYASRESREINMQAPKWFGALVGVPFSLEISATGAGPLSYTAENLPPGLTFDNGIISGAINEPGDFTIEVEVTGSEGSVRRSITIICLDLPYGAAPEPVISGPRVVGTTPGRPFLFLIPASGEAPLTFSAVNLPEGLSLDPATGIITGSLRNKGEFDVDITVTNAFGSTSRSLRIIGGEHKLALTPPMGWNSWNAWGMAVDDEKVRSAAEWMVKLGLAARGFMYINIDDGWEGGRDENGEILPNEKFSDMQALAGYVHSHGLRIGIYSSPGPKTCGGLEASYQHEQQDALTWSKWGFDYIKYDWCSYATIVTPKSREDNARPYKLMRECLDNCDRDIIFSVCWSAPEVGIWAPEAGGNLWRTTGDIVDTWGSVSSIGFSHDGYERYAGPGHWNDPDMLVLGKVGWGPTLHNTRLTPYEQITHITLWCLLAAPLLLGCDLSRLDPFTVALLTNEEVIDIDQDPLGKPANRRSKDGDKEVWARPLWDGTIAAGLFNRGSEPTEVTVNWSDLGITGVYPVRDLWRKKDLGAFTNSFTVTVPPHGAAMVKIGK